MPLRKTVLLLPAFVLLSGCGGTSPTLRQPQFASEVPVRSVPLPDGASTAEAKLAPLAPIETAPGTFLTPPYIQLGNAPALGGKTESLALLWQTKGVSANGSLWSVETRPAGSETWQKVTAKPVAAPVAIESLPHTVWNITLPNLKPGALFDYRVLREKKPVFAARARARRGADEPFRFVVFGDCSEDTAGQKKIAYQTSLLQPDFVFITGDIVYARGRVAEYQQKYFPVYNPDKADPAIGAPLIRSTLFLGSPGNHDIGGRDLEKSPDGLAYFYYWSQPLNGPLTMVNAPNTPAIRGSEAEQKTFLAAAGNRYPRMANFSFDYGNSHWTVLDANPNVDWSDPALRAWLQKDLQGASKAAWRFVAFHQPPFNSSKAHHDEQQMRVLTDLFEKNKVSVVFSGHVHNYQRTFPLHFVPVRGLDGNWRDGRGRVQGKWNLDKTFDGSKNTVANGVIYIITGGGGAGLYNPEQQEHPETWEPFTAKYVADAHSLTQVDITGKTMTVRQIDDTGKERDHFTLTN